MAYYNAGSDRNLNNNIDCPDDNYIVDDLSIVPLEKDSFAICEFCGLVGRRGQFYSRNNKFCTLRCARRNRSSTWRFKIMEGTQHMADFIPLEPLPQLQYWQADNNESGPTKKTPLPANSYEWKDELFGCDFLAAPVNLFKHAPLHEVCTFEGMKVEVKNTESDNDPEKLNDYFWVATVLKIKGYMGLLRYEGCGSDDSKDFWVNLCCTEIHPVGWCATRGKPIIPPQSIADKYTDWKKFLVRQLTGARTLPANFYTKLNDSLVSRFSVGCVMEVVDKNKISQVKVATVIDIVGKRLHVRYDHFSNGSGFWCHEDSPLIHPVGWAFRIGHPLDAPQSYLQRVATGRLRPNDTLPDMFYKYPTSEPLFTAGQKIEAIDPLNLSSFCPATVMKMLNEGFMMIRIDSYPPEQSGSDWFCYHHRSPSIFPVGFAEANNIPLVPPPGYTVEAFSWETYLHKTGASAAPHEAFAARGHVVSHGFVAGMRLECADLMDPKLVCVATVARVVADLLKVHFDGWGAEYDQWLWAHSTDVYPVGWCRAVGYRLEASGVPPQAQRVPTKRTAKPTRRRRRPVAAKAQHPPNTTEESSQNSDMGDNKCLFLPKLEACTDVNPQSDMGDNKCLFLPNLEACTDVNPKSDMSDNKCLFLPKLEACTDVNPQCDNIMDVDIKSHLHATEKLENVNRESERQNATMETGNDTKKICNVVYNLNGEVCESDEYLGDTSHPVALSTSTDPAHKYAQDVPPTSTERPFVEDNNKDNKVIPRLVNTAVPIDVLNTVEPENWTTVDVAKFLTVNDCQTYCVNFSHITGPMLMQLTKDEIIELLEMKVGPSLKIFDLITQLKGKLNPGRILSFK